jgi:hypothetical protein
MHPPSPLRRPRLVFLALLLGFLAAVARGGIVLESNQSPLDGSLLSGGSGISGGAIKVLPFLAGTSGLQLSAVEVGLKAASAGSYQVEFRIYSVSNVTGEPLALLYAESFTPTLSTTSAWYSLALNYTLSASTRYAFGFANPGPLANSRAESDVVRWANAQNSSWPALGYQGYAGVVATAPTPSGYNFYTDWDSTNLIALTPWSWRSASASNAFRLYAVPERASPLIFVLGLGAVSALHHRRRGPRRPHRKA